MRLLSGVFMVGTALRCVHTRSLADGVSVMSWNVNGLRSLLKHDANGDLLRSLGANQTIT